MNNQRFIESVLKVISVEGSKLNQDISLVDYEYLLRYFEINRDRLADKYQIAFLDDWELNLIKSFRFFCSVYASNGDIRILNTLYKCRRYGRKLFVDYLGNDLNSYVYTSLKGLKNE